MANFSQLFPNLQGGIDFDDATASGDLTAAQGDGSQLIAKFAQVSNVIEADPTHKIPAKLLPDTKLNDAFQYTAAGATITTFATAWNAGTATGITPAPTGAVLHNGDIVQVVDSTPNPDTMTTYVYTGDDSTFSTGPDVAAGEFIQISTAVGVTSVASSGNNNVSVNSTVDGSAQNGAITIDLDSSLTHIASIENESGVAFGLGNQNAVSTLSGAATNIIAAGEIDLTGNAVDINATAAATINGATVDLAASGLLQLSSNLASGVAVDIDASQAAGTININAVGTTGAGSIVIDAGDGELRIGGEDIQNGTASVSRVLGIGAQGQLTTANITVGGGAQAVDGTTETATTTGETADVNAVYFIAPKTIAAYTLILPAAGTAGNWIKIVNRSNFKAGNVVKDPAVATGADLKTTVTLNTATGQIVGNGTDSTFVMNDTTANFEMISDGTNWNIIAS